MSERAMMRYLTTTQIKNPGHKDKGLLLQEHPSHTHEVSRGKLSQTVADPRPCMGGLTIYLTKITESCPVNRIKKADTASAILFRSARWSFTGSQLSTAPYLFTKSSLSSYTLFLAILKY